MTPKQAIESGFRVGDNIEYRSRMGYGPWAKATIAHLSDMNITARNEHCFVDLSANQQIRRFVDEAISDGTNGTPRMGRYAYIKHEAPYMITATDRMGRVIYSRNATFLEIISFKILEWVKGKMERRP